MTEKLKKKKKSRQAKRVFRIRCAKLQDVTLLVTLIKKCRINMFAIFNLYFFASILMYVWLMKSRRMKWAGHVARMVQKSYAYRIFVERLEMNMPVCWSRWKDNIKMNLKSEFEDVD